MMNDQHDELSHLIDYIRSNIAEISENADIDYRFQIPEVVPPIHLKQKYRRNIYLVVKEAVHNIVKHASASCISVEIEINGSLTIRIRDNGKGINLDKQRMFSNGLRNMEQRANEIGGEVRICNDNGTIVVLSAPLPN
jgi:signal transduction histidine kinase